MLRMRTVLRRDGIELTDVACRHPAGCGIEDEHVGAHALVLVRRGCFVHHAGTIRTVLDPTVAYAMRPGDEHRFDHPTPHGDDCTSLSLAPDLVAELWGGEADLPPGALAVGPAADLEHRLLLAAASRGDDRDVLAERAVVLAASVLEGADARRVASGRPTTVRVHAALADRVREALAEDPGRPLPALARDLGVSRHHLVRIFRARTGTTVARHRMRLRTRAALERLAGGERDLARLAADVGFSDQGHLTRVVRAETGGTPAALRAALQTNFG